MINGNAVGGIVGYGKTFILTDENGNEITAVVTDEVQIFNADPLTDIREGKVAATDSGVVTGAAIIPNYDTCEGTKIILNGSTFSLSMKEDYDYTKLQAIICNFNNNSTDSVSAEKVAIEDKVYAVQSTEVLSSVVKNAENSAIDFGITNTSGNMKLIRYFLYKELY